MIGVVGALLAGAGLGGLLSRLWRVREIGFRHGLRYALSKRRPPAEPAAESWAPARHMPVDGSRDPFDLPWFPEGDA